MNQPLLQESERAVSHFVMREKGFLRMLPNLTLVTAKMMEKVRETNDIKGNTFDEYKSIIGKKPSKDKGKDTELMPDYDMTGENVSEEVLKFSDDSDDE